MVIRTSKIELTLSTISSNRTLNRLPRQHTGKSVAALERDILQGVQAGVLGRQCQTRLGNIDTQPGCGSRSGGMKAEAAGVAESVEHAPPCRQARHGTPVFALIEIEAG